MQKYSQIHLSDQYVVQLNKILGKGSTGSVYEGFDLKKNQKVAVKVIDLNLIDNQVTKYLLNMQKNAIMLLQSSSVLKGLKVFQDEKYCFIVTQFCNGGTLKKYISDRNCINQQKSLQIIKSILEGYQNLVNNKVVHRDLKPANIMMHNDLPKIIDFGYCQIEGYQKPTLQYNVGSPSYMAPESYNLNIYNQKTEIWSIGIILFQCLTGRTVDQGRKMPQVFKMIQRFGIPYPDYISKKCRNIIDQCTRLNPQKRPSCSELYKKYFDVSKNFNQFGVEQLLKTQKSISTQNSNNLRSIQNNSNKQINFPSFTILNQKMSINNKNRQIFQTNQFPKYNKYTQNRMKTAFSCYQSARTSHNSKQLQAYQYYENAKKIQNDTNIRKMQPHTNHFINQYDSNRNLMTNSVIPQQNKKSKLYDNFFKANPQMSLVRNKIPSLYVGHQNAPKFIVNNIENSGHYGNENHIRNQNLIGTNAKMIASTNLNINMNKNMNMSTNPNYNLQTQRIRRTTFRI